MLNRNQRPVSPRSHSEDKWVGGDVHNLLAHYPKGLRMYEVDPGMLQQVSDLMSTGRIRVETEPFRPGSSLTRKVLFRA